jgi:phosphoribosylglycinamide formyltransferase-1
MKKIAVFASGSGSNAENIAQYFEEKPDITVSCILCNNPKAFVIERAKKLNIPSFIFNRDDFYNSTKVLDYLRDNDIDFIVLAGFLWLIPENLVKQYPNKIVNIHPALLPNYGGKGMYGMRVHESVIANNESKSGISIHIVNEKYDEGSIVFQAECKIEEGETPESLANKVHELEYKHFPEVIEKLVKQ